MSSTNYLADYPPHATRWMLLAYWRTLFNLELATCRSGHNAGEDAPWERSPRAQAREEINSAMTRSAMTRVWYGAEPPINDVVEDAIADCTAAIARLNHEQRRQVYAALAAKEPDPATFLQLFRKDPPP